MLVTTYVQAKMSHNTIQIINLAHIFLGPKTAECNISNRNNRKTMIRKVLLTLLTLLVSFVFTHLINFLLIGKIIIGDPCDYDTKGKDTSKLFDLFFTVSSNTGYHPEPSFFNFYFTTGVSVMIATFFAYRLIWKGQK